MADETFPLRIQLKRKTTAQWASQNPVLLKGEPGIEVLSDGSEKIKYGDGVKTWSALSYAAGGGAGGTAWLQGAGVPANNLGKAGDFYLRTSNGDVYGPKTDVWGAVSANLASTVTIGTVTTGAAGSPAMVSNSGTAMDPILDFVLPRADPATLSSAAPQSLGTTAAPGTSTDGSRADHVHPRPTAGQVGADPTGTAAAAVAAHEAAADPHPAYLTATEGNAAYATAAQGALAATAIQPGNSALSDSREWSADTISQAEAETGTATTRRAFTALRVFQAIASWWNGSAAKTKLDGIETGAQANVATNLSYDATTRNLASSTGSPAVLPLFGSSAAGLVPASGGGTSNFLRADGTFAALPGGTPGGSSGQIQFNNGGAFGGLSTLTADGSGNLTLSARLTNSYNAAASAPAKLFSGTWFTGGTSTTTKPHVLIEPSGTASNNFSTAGTGLGVNAPSGFAGDLAWFGVGGVRQGVIKSDSSFQFGRFGALNYSSGFIVTTDLSGVAYSGYWGSDKLQVHPSMAIAWGSAQGYDGATLALYRDAAHILAQRNGLDAQTTRIYNTFTSATNFERAKVEWAGNILRIGTEKGTAGGTARDMELQTDGTTRITLKANGAILFSGLPTTNPNVAGQLWNDGGTLKISA